jgi:hypothetical protein
MITRTESVVCMYVCVCQMCVCVCDGAMDGVDSVGREPDGPIQVRHHGRWVRRLGAFSFSFSS